jgi:hypothetical protein
MSPGADESQNGRREKSDSACAGILGEDPRSSLSCEKVERIDHVLPSGENSRRGYRNLYRFARNLNGGRRPFAALGSEGLLID